MDNKALKGIALILFGILLCVASTEINSSILSSWSEIPFSLVGVVVGAGGLVMVFDKK